MNSELVRTERPNLFVVEGKVVGWEEYREAVQRFYRGGSARLYCLYFERLPQCPKGHDVLPDRAGVVGLSWPKVCPTCGTKCKKVSVKRYEEKA